MSITMKRKSTMSKTYQDLLAINQFSDRFEFLRMRGNVGDQTFGSHRYLNQKLYQSQEWKRVRRDIILRDNGCDLAHPDYPIYGQVLIHHIEPITIDDILDRNDKVLDPRNLVCVSFQTHNALHYGDANLLIREYIGRTKNDTCPWR